MMASTHFIGIGGTGMSAIARVLLERGEQVSGSDREMSPQALALQNDGARIFEGHSAEQVNGARRVIRSSAIPDENVELVQALEKSIPVLKRADALKDMLKEQHVIAIAGSHGKTTTSAMLAWILVKLGKDPGYIVGSDMLNLASNASAGNGDLFVVEADEYDYMFLGLAPKLMAITNVEHDHPDIFPSEKSFFQAFESFVDRLQMDGQLLYCLDNPGASQIGNYAKANAHTAYSYSIEDHSADYCGMKLKARAGEGQAFEFNAPARESILVELQVAGKHHAENAVAAMAMAGLLNLPLEEAALALSEFSGTSRRFQIAGEAKGILFVDDYAHHPTEIRASLAAAKEQYPDRRVLALWQPHTFSRTALLWDDFVDSFKQADEVVVTPVFAAREQSPPDFDLASDIAQLKHAQFNYRPSLSAAEDYLAGILANGDLLIVLSAGDALSLNQGLLARLGNEQ